MADIIVSAAGAAIGFVVGGPAGAQWGWALGSLIGQAFAPGQKSQGPRLDDLTVTGMAFGQPIPWIQGTHRTAGQLIWSSDRREIATTVKQGKGGAKSQSTTYTYEVDCLFLLSCNELEGLLRVWNNGKLAYTSDQTAADASLIASTENDLWRRITFYSGAPGQMPDPVYEAAVGAGNAPAYLDMCTVFIEGLQLGQSGQMLNLTFEVGTNLSPGLRDNFQDQSSNQIVVLDDLEDPTSRGFLGCVEEGQFGDAGEFEGESLLSTQGLAVGAANAPDVAGSDWTFECWLKTKGAGYTTGRGTIVSTTQNLIPIRGLFASSTITGAVTGTFRLDNPGTVFAVNLISADGVVPIGQWFHFAIERLGTLIRMYVGGVEVASGDMGVSASFIMNEPWTLGAVGGTGAGGWNGFMDDVRLSNVARYRGDFVPPTEPHANDQETVFLIPFYRLNTTARGTETIRTVVERLCARAGMPADSYDASALDAITKPVRALAVSQVGGTRAVLDMLGQVFFFQAICTDKVYFIPRAQSVVATIPFKDLGTGQAQSDTPEPFALRQRNDLEVPAQEAITYANVADDYQADTQYSDRLLSSQTNTGTSEVPLGFTPSEAKAIADAKVTDGAISVWGSQISLSRKHAMLTPGDSVLVESDDGSTYRMLLGRQTQSSGVIGFEARLEDPTVFTQAGVTGGDYSPQTEVVAIANTYLLMLDIPLLRDADDGVGLYAAARGLSSGWPGAEVFESTDNLAFESRATITEAAVLGIASTALGDWSAGNVFDETSTVTVNVGSASLSSATRDELLASTTLNASLIGGEIVQFRSASMLSAGVYVLSGFLRGRRGTDRVMTSHTAGERFVLLQPLGMRRVPQAIADLAALRYFRGVSLGRSLSTGATQEVTNTGVSDKPFAPVNARANRATTDTAITWDRRSRKESRFLGPLSSSVPLGEATEAYEIEIYTSSAFTMVSRTLTSATPAVTYTSAQQVIDFGSNRTVLYVRIYQMSETVGRGFPLQATI